MFCREVDVASCIFIGSAVLAVVFTVLNPCPHVLGHAVVPGALAHVHFPPDTYVFLGLEPLGNIAHDIWFVEVVHQVRGQEVCCFITDDGHAPRGFKRGWNGGFVAVLTTHQAAHEAVIARFQQGHAAVIYQCRLVNAHVRAVLVHKGHRGAHTVLHNMCRSKVRMIGLAQRIDLTSLCVVVGVLIDFPVPRNPMRCRIFCEVELRALVGHHK